MKKTILMAVIVLAGLCARGATSPSTSDMFDVSQGSTITANSGYYSGSSGTDMFGASAGSVEPTRTLFADGHTNGFVHYVEFKTAAPISLEEVRLFAGGDGALYNNEREFSGFKLKAKSPGSSTFDVTIISYTATHPYTFIDASTFLIIDQTLGTPVVAKEFRAEFTNYVAGRGFDGPRIVELDGFGSIAPDWQDVFDVSLGSSISASSGYYSGPAGNSSGTDMFGDDASTAEPTSTIFADGHVTNFVHYVEFSTASPVNLTGIRLFAAGDGPSLGNEREFTSFTLKAKGSGSSTYNITVATLTPSHPYTFVDADTYLLYAPTFSTVTAQDFRAEFVQYTGGRGFDGPRVMELDGIGTFVP
jgi:hypothetical protein